MPLQVRQSPERSSATPLARDGQIGAVRQPGRAAPPSPRRDTETAPQPSVSLDASVAAHRRRYARGRVRQALLATADASALLIAIGTSAVALDFPRTNTVGAWAIPLMLVAWIATLHVYGLYPRVQRYVTASTLDEIPRFFHAALVAFVLSWILLTALSGTGLGEPFALAAVLTLILTPALRAIARALHTRVLGPERVLMIGRGSTSAAVERALSGRRDTTLVGRADLPPHWHRESPTADASTLRVLADAVATQHIDRLLLPTHELSDSAVGEFLHWSRQINVSLTVLPEHFDVVGMGASIDQLQGASMVSLQPPMLSRTSRGFKRSLDIVGAAGGLLILAPLIVATAIAVRLDSSGPVLFRQERVGRGGRTFQLLKFRTMVPDADALLEGLMTRSTDPNWLQIEDDPRVTRVGRLLRATSLDELPQLWNVLVGHMSLVGPRPLSVRDDARVNGWARGRLDITPGLTGLWQVSGRKSVPFEEMVKLDYLYVNNWSVWGDVKLLLLTLPAVVAGRGAR
ncbi:MAG: sugar transferase [Patulibacter sp.]|nr:sugar transferase [Patulibacter sp.]